MNPQNTSQPATVETEKMSASDRAILRLAYLEKYTLEVELQSIQQQLNILYQQGQEKLKKVQGQEAEYHLMLEEVTKKTNHVGWEADTENGVWRRELPVRLPEVETPSDGEKLHAV